MPRLDDMSPERLDALVDGALPTDAEERELVGMMNELRALEPETPAALAEKVRTLAQDEPDPRAAARGLAPGLWARITEPFRARPRLAWGLAPALVVIALAVVTIPALNDSEPPAAGDAAIEASDGVDVAPEPLAGDVPGEEAGSDDALRLSEPEAAADEAQSLIEPGTGRARDAGDVGVPLPVPEPPTTAVPPDAVAPGANPERPQELFGQTTLGVADASALSKAAAGAMDLVRGLGGFTERSDFSTQSDDVGRADLVLRVPTDKTEEALTGFADLGTVINQRVSINDLGEELAAARDRVVELTRRVSQLKSQLAADPGNTRLENQLASAERALERAKANRADTNAEVAERTRFATLSLAIVVTDQIGATDDENRFAAAIERAWDRLGGVLAGALEILIVASPLILIAGLGLWGARVARRRSENGLLAKP